MKYHSFLSGEMPLEPVHRMTKDRPVRLFPLSSCAGTQFVLRFCLSERKWIWKCCFPTVLVSFPGAVAREMLYSCSEFLVTETLVVGGLNGRSSYQVIWHLESRSRKRPFLVYNYHSPFNSLVHSAKKWCCPLQWNWKKSLSGMPMGQSNSDSLSYSRCSQILPDW